jgi:hypothetical protein
MDWMVFAEGHGRRYRRHGVGRDRMEFREQRRRGFGAYGERVKMHVSQPAAEELHVSFSFEMLMLPGWVGSQP